MVDAPNGGGFLEIETANKVYALRSGDSAVRPEASRLFISAIHLKT